MTEIDDLIARMRSLGDDLAANECTGLADDAYEAATALAALRTRAETAERERDSAHKRHGETDAILTMVESEVAGMRVRAEAAEARVHELSAAPNLPGLRRAMELVDQTIGGRWVLACNAMRDALRAEIEQQEAFYDTKL